MTPKSLPWAKNADRPEGTLAAALGYAEQQGWPVFPVHGIVNGRCTWGVNCGRNAGKHPRTEDGFKAATTDPDTIRAWWARWPNANIGIPTGLGTFVAVDVDPRHGGDRTLAALLAKHGSLPATMEQHTGGSGRHILFTCPDAEIRSKSLGPGLDLKANGGYIIVTPSLHLSGKHYKWETASRPGAVDLAPCPEWVLAIADKTDRGAVQPEEWAVTVPEGDRHTTAARLAGSLLTRMAPADVLGLMHGWNQSRCAPPIPDDELRKIVEDLARKEGAKAESVRINYTIEFGEFVEQYGGQAETFLVQDWIPEGGLCFLYGLPGTWKTWLAQALMVAIALGEPFLGMPVKQGTVQYYPLEGTFGGIIRRLTRMVSHGGPAPKVISEGVNAQGQPMQKIVYFFPRWAVIRKKLFVHPGRSFNFADQGEMAAFVASIRRDQPVLVVIETLIDAAGEGALKDHFADTAKLVNRQLRPLCDELGTAFLIVHHAPHVSSGRMWGSVFLEAKRDCLIGLELVAAGNGWAKVLVNRYLKEHGKPPDVLLDFDLRERGFELAETALEDAPDKSSNLGGLLVAFLRRRHPEKVTAAQTRAELGLSASETHIRKEYAKLEKAGLVISERGGVTEPKTYQWRAVPNEVQAPDLQRVEG